jgi:hypothetical protein
VSHLLQLSAFLILANSNRVRISIPLRNSSFKVRQSAEETQCCMEQFFSIQNFRYLLIKLRINWKLEKLLRAEKWRRKSLNFYTKFYFKIKFRVKKIQQLYTKIHFLIHFFDSADRTEKKAKDGGLHHLECVP